VFHNPWVFRVPYIHLNKGRYLSIQPFLQQNWRNAKFFPNKKKRKKNRQLIYLRFYNTFISNLEILSGKLRVSSIFLQ